MSEAEFRASYTHAAIAVWINAYNVPVHYSQDTVSYEEGDCAALVGCGACGRAQHVILDGATPLPYAEVREVLRELVVETGCTHLGPILKDNPPKGFEVCVAAELRQ